MISIQIDLFQEFNKYTILDGKVNEGDILLSEQTVAYALSGCLIKQLLLNLIKDEQISDQLQYIEHTTEHTICLLNWIRIDKVGKDNQILKLVGFDFPQKNEIAIGNFQSFVQFAQRFLFFIKQKNINKLLNEVPKNSKLFTSKKTNFNMSKYDDNQESIRKVLSQWLAQILQITEKQASNILSNKHLFNSFQKNPLINNDKIKKFLLKMRDNIQFLREQCVNNIGNLIYLFQALVYGLMMPDNIDYYIIEILHKIAYNIPKSQIQGRSFLQNKYIIDVFILMLKTQIQINRDNLNKQITDILLLVSRKDFYLKPLRQRSNSLNQYLIVLNKIAKINQQLWLQVNNFYQIFSFDLVQFVKIELQKLQPMQSFVNQKIEALELVFQFCRIENKKNITSSTTFFIRMVEKYFENGKYVLYFKGLIKIFQGCLLQNPSQFVNFLTEKFWLKTSDHKDHFIYLLLLLISQRPKICEPIILEVLQSMQLNEEYVMNINDIELIFKVKGMSTGIDKLIFKIAVYKCIENPGFRNLFNQIYSEMQSNNFEEEVIEILQVIEVNKNRLKEFKLENSSKIYNLHKNIIEKIEKEINLKLENINKKNEYPKTTTPIIKIKKKSNQIVIKNYTTNNILENQSIQKQPLLPKVFNVKNKKVPESPKGNFKIGDMTKMQQLPFQHDFRSKSKNRHQFCKIKHEDMILEQMKQHQKQKQKKRVLSKRRFDHIESQKKFIGVKQDFITKNILQAGAKLKIKQSQKKSQMQLPNINKKSPKRLKMIHLKQNLLSEYEQIQYNLNLKIPRKPQYKEVQYRKIQRAQIVMKNPKPLVKIEKQYKEKNLDKEKSNSDYNNNKCIYPFQSVILKNHQNFEKIRLIDLEKEEDRDSLSIAYSIQRNKNIIKNLFLFYGKREFTLDKDNDIRIELTDAIRMLKQKKLNKFMPSKFKLQIFKYIVANSQNKNSLNLTGFIQYLINILFIFVNKNIQYIKNPIGFYFDSLFIEIKENKGMNQEHESQSSKRSKAIKLKNKNKKHQTTFKSIDFVFKLTLPNKKTIKKIKYILAYQIVDHIFNKIFRQFNSISDCHFLQAYSQSIIRGNQIEAEKLFNLENQSVYSDTRSFYSDNSSFFDRDIRSRKQNKKKLDVNQQQNIKDNKIQFYMNVKIDQRQSQYDENQQIYY